MRSRWRAILPPLEGGRAVSLFTLMLGLALAGCSSHSDFPWSLEGKAIPPFTIVKKHVRSDPDIILFTLAVVVSNNISEEGLTLVSQKIIEDLPAHHLAFVNFYSDPREIAGEFTIGKAVWGVKDPEHDRPAGDYSQHVIRLHRR